MTHIKDENGKTIAFWDNKKLLDKHKRPLIELHKNDNVILFRYIDTDDELKYIIAELYNMLTNQDREKILRFLNFDDEMFCS